MSELGAAGLAALERLADRFDREDLDFAIYALTAALDADPWHHDALRWHWELCRLYGVRGDLEHSVSDLDTAVELSEDLVELSGPDDAVHDPAVITLADWLWEQARLNGPADPQSLVKRYERLESEAVGPVARQAVRGMCGMALLELDEQEATDRAIGLLEEAIPVLAGVPADDPYRELADDGRVAWLMTILSGAYQTRSRDRPDLDRAVEVARAAVERDRIEPATRMRPIEALANAFDLRWQLREAEGDEGAGDDLDAAIAAWSQTPDDGETALFRGILLAQRADRRDDPHDAEVAAVLLVEAATGDSDEPAALLAAAATVRRVRWEITGDLDDLESTVRLAEQAAAAARDDYYLIYAHIERMYAELSLRENGRARPGLAGGSSRLAETVEDAVRVLDRAVRADLADRAFFAGVIGLMTISAADPDSGRLDLTRARGLLTLAADALPDADGHALFGAMLGTADLLADFGNARASDGQAMRRLIEAHTATENDAESRERVTEALETAMRIRGGLTGNRRLLAAAGRLQDRKRRWAPPTTGRRPRGPHVAIDDPLDRLTFRVLALIREGREPAAREAIVAARDLLEARDNGFGRYGVAYLRALAASIDPLAGPLLARPVDQPDPGLLGIGIITAVLTDLALCRQNLARGFRRAAIERAEHIEHLLDRLTERDRSLRHDLAMMAGLIRLALAETAENAADAEADADRAVPHLRSAIAGSAGVLSTVWCRITMWCGHGLRLCSTPDLAGSRAMGRSALEGHAWQVFAQSGTDYAMAAARGATADAATLVNWCLADRATGPAVIEELITALDGSRALVLRAFGASRRVPDLLRARQRGDLASAWEASAGQGTDLLSGSILRDTVAGGGIEVPDELRHRVVAALGEQATFGLETVTSAEIRDGLRAAGRDALVYLVPGAAVVVPAGTDPYLIDLPGLSEEPVRGHARSGPAARDLGPAGREDPADLDGLCAWAWQAAMGPLIAAGPGRRVVLVPMGRLALVPWHAAYREDDGGRHYAIEHLVVSYSPSARLLTAVAPKPQRAIGSALVLGDPTGDLPAAGDEARAVHDRFYPGGTYLEAAGPDDVRRWLSTQSEGAAVLHLACHAAVDPARPADARLILAGGDLSLRELLDQFRRSALRIDQVFLAACSTGAASDDYDESLSFAASFLAAGARTVFGSLWPVPDNATSVLMYLIHHYLREEGCDPATALHRAQLRMLDPSRSMPTGTPDRLRRRHRAAGPIPELSAWAGFIHLGG